MRCKQGDLAVVVRCEEFPELIGRFVLCVSFLPGPDGSPAWVIDRPLHAGRQTARGFALGDWWRDSNLRPIRDSDGTDETLTDVFRPAPIEA